MKRLREWLAAHRTDLERRLHALRAAPAQGVCSFSVDLGPSPCPLIPQHWGKDAVYWAQPARDIRRLALGSALTVSSGGPARFSALQAAFAGLAPYWLHEDPDGTGASPSAHLGFAFHADGKGVLPNARLVLPSLLLEQRAGRDTLTLSFAVRDAASALAGWEGLLRPPTGSPATTPPAGEATALLERSYLARVRAALAEIAAGRLEKVVLARSSSHEAAEPIDIAALLASLESRHPACTIFAIGYPGGCFAGATPERLFRLRQGRVLADALAGTNWLGSNQRSGGLSLQGAKNSREQQLVVDAVRAALSPLCAELDPPGLPQILQLHRIEHLHSRVEGTLHAHVGLFDLVAALHPTPAVGGSPTALAQDWLIAHGEKRGAWYTGGIGWVERKGDGEIAVPLRCADIQGRVARLFAGAGIVAGSEPAQELAETEVKFGAMRQALAEAAAIHTFTVAQGVPCPPPTEKARASVGSSDGRPVDGPLASPPARLLRSATR